MLVGVILTLVYALAIAQAPIDATNAESTITVKKKERKDLAPAPAEKPPPPPTLPQVTPAPPPTVAEVVTTAETPRPVRIVPWVTLGGSIVATAVGVFFAVRTTQVLEEQSELEFTINTSKSRVNVPPEFADSQKAVFINALVATVLISAGVSGTIASSIALVSD